MPQPTSSPPSLKILALHGYTQSGPLFRLKTRALEKTLQKHLKSLYPSHFTSLHIEYPTAPIRIRPADFPQHLNKGGEDRQADDGKVNGESKNNDDDDVDFWGWWVRRGKTEPFTYEGMEAGFDAIASHLHAAALEEQPFDGVIGFSQGGAMAALVASLLEPGRREAFERKRAEGGMAFPSSFVKSPGAQKGSDGGEGALIHPPLKFVVSYSGFAATTNALYTPFYEPKITTPVLHFLGSVDTVVEEERSLRLVRSCAGKERVVRHPGGHHVPTGTAWVGAVAEFMGEVTGWHEGKARKDERVEDMDVPF